MTGLCAADRRRTGFTLVELLIVIALIIVIAALTVAVLNSGLVGSQKVVSGSDRASGWLLIAKQRAIRDRGARGVRFFLTQPDPTNAPTLFAATEAQYIEAPDPWVPNPYGAGPVIPPRTNSQGLRFGSPPPGGNDAKWGAHLGRIVFLYQADVTNPGSPANGVVTNRRAFFVSDDVDDIIEFDQRILGNGNELLLLPDFPSPFRIKSAPPTGQSISLQNQTYGPNDPRVRELILESYPDLGAAFSQTAPGSNPQPAPACCVTYKFAFQESPRPLLGEPTLQLTAGTMIDTRPAQNPVPTTLGVNYVTNAAGVPQFFDILFSASGQVMYNANPIICLWVRDADKLKDLGNHPRVNQSGQVDNQAPRGPTNPYDNAGDQVLVTVYPKTGFIATHPVAPPDVLTPTGPDPYQYAKDGLNNGL